MSDLATVRARTQKIVEMASQIEEAPWTNLMAARERTVTAGYAEWAAIYDNANNPMFLAEEPVGGPCPSTARTKAHPPSRA